MPQTGPTKSKNPMGIQSPEFPEFNTSRIDAIRNRLDDDTYTVDIQHLTSKLIDLEIALSGPGKKQAA